MFSQVSVFHGGSPSRGETPLRQRPFPWRETSSGWRLPSGGRPPLDGDSPLEGDPLWMETPILVLTSSDSQCSGWYTSAGMHSCCRIVDDRPKRSTQNNFKKGYRLM